MNLLAHAPSFRNASREQQRPPKRMRQAESEPRSSLRCDACRKRKIKCLPLQRDWLRGEKCQKCIEKGEPCGPHRRFNDPAEGAVPQAGEPPPQRAWEAPQGQRPTPIAPARLRPTPSGIAIQPNFQSDSAPVGFPHTQSGSPHEAGSRPDALRVGDSAVAGPSSEWYRPRLSQNAFPTTPRPPVNHHPQPAHLTKSVEVRVKQGFISLRHAYALYLTSQSRRQQVARATPFQPDRHFDHIDAAVDHHLGLAYNDFVGKLSSQSDNINSCAGDKKEPLRMLLGFAKKFLGQSKPPDASCEQHGKKVYNIYTDVLLQLVYVCYDDGEQEEADELLLELVSLPGYRVPCREILSWVSQALERRSEAINEAFSQLEILPTKKTVFNDSGNIFPVSNAAIEAGLDWSSLSRISSGSSHSDSSDDGSYLHDTIQRRSLHIAVECCNLDQVRYLVDNQANLEARDSLSMTPLLLASLAGHLGIFRLLSEAGANSDARDRYGRNAMIIACEKGNVEIVRFLMARIRYNPDEEYEIQECTLLYAAASQGYSSIVQLLLTAGADPQKRVKGKLPYDAATERRHTEVVHILEQTMSGPFLDNPELVAASGISAPTRGHPTGFLPTLEPSPTAWRDGGDPDGYSLLTTDGSLYATSSIEQGNYLVVQGQFDHG